MSTTPRRVSRGRTATPAGGDARLVELGARHTLLTQQANAIFRRYRKLADTMPCVAGVAAKLRWAKRLLDQKMPETAHAYVKAALVDAIKLAGGSGAPQGRR